MTRQAAEDGDEVASVSLAQAWAEIDAVVSRSELAAALDTVTDLAGPPDSDEDEVWRAELVRRFDTVRPFLRRLCEVVTFDASPEGQQVLTALRGLPRLWGGGCNKVDRSEIDERLLVGSWKRLVLAAPHLEAGSVDWKAYTFCVLEQFHRLLRRRDIFAVNSSKWSDPRAKLLSGPAWEATKPKVLASLELPEDPEQLLAERADESDVAAGGSARAAASGSTELSWTRCSPTPSPARTSPDPSWDLSPSAGMLAFVWLEPSATTDGGIADSLPPRKRLR